MKSLTDRQRYAYLPFDGEHLYWIDDSTPSNNRKWKTYSGREGYWSPAFQKIKDTGPLPKGEYIVRQSRYQRWQDLSIKDKALCIMKRGPWPKYTTAWGMERVWLEMLPGTNTHGRDKFTIHGGSYPGSGGCIDLTDKMTPFALRFRKHIKDMKLIVRYKPLPKGRGYHNSRLAQ